MKNLIVFGLLIMAMVFAQFTQAQTVDDIVNKWVDAMGGKDKLASLKTVKMEGNFSAQGNDFPITNVRSHMVGMRMDFEIMGTSNYQVANKTKGSAFWPIRQQTAPEAMDPEQFKSAQNQMDVQGALFNYKDKGTTVELVGKETVDGSEAYNLKLTYKNGIIANYYIDTKTNRMVKISGKVTVQGQEMEVSTSYSDYKQNADGFWFPYTIVTPQGTITYDKISTNIPIDESLFNS